MCEHCGCGEHSHTHGEGETHKIEINQDVMAHEKAHAEKLRQKLGGMDSRLLNIIGSPGCGKTELLAKLIPLLQAEGLKSVVIEGDLSTDNDASDHCLAAFYLLAAGEYNEAEKRLLKAGEGAADVRAAFE